MKTNLYKLVTALVLIFLSLHGTAFAVLTSTTYRIEGDTIDSGGGVGTRLLRTRTTQTSCWRPSGMPFSLSFRTKS